MDWPLTIAAITITGTLAGLAIARVADAFLHWDSELPEQPSDDIADGDWPHVPEIAGTPTSEARGVSAHPAARHPIIGLFGDPHASGDTL